MEDITPWLGKLFFLTVTFCLFSFLLTRIPEDWRKFEFSSGSGIYEDWFAKANVRLDDFNARYGRITRVMAFSVGSLYGGFTFISSADEFRLIVLMLVVGVFGLCATAIVVSGYWVVRVGSALLGSGPLIVRCGIVAGIYIVLIACSIFGIYFFIRLLFASIRI